VSKRLREMRLSRARAARADKPVAPDSPTTVGPPCPALGPSATAKDPATPAPDLTEKFAEKARDLDAVRKSVEDAATVSAGFWLSYLFVLFYIGIAAGAVTHRDLLLENPVKLPALNVELPLVAFFVLAPILFIVSHAYTLVHFVMLGAKVGMYDAKLRLQLGNAPETREGLRWQLPSNIFVQFLAGPGNVRKGCLGWLLKTIAWISLVIGPVLLLLLIQVQFLPYHLELVTWLQRAAIVVDVILLWALWPAVLNGRSKLMWRLERRGKSWPGVLALTGRYIAGLAACLIPVGLAFTAATFPGERMEDWIGNKQWIPLGAKDGQGKPISTSFHDLLFHGDVNPDTGGRGSPFSNTLVLSGFEALQAAKIDDPKKLGIVKHSVVLRQRHLENAVFYNADLREADLTRAQLQGASLARAQLQGASLDYAQLQGASLDDEQLQGASLREAQLQGASLEGAQLQGTSLREAQLQGASLDNAILRGALLDGAYLWRAQLDERLIDMTSFQGLVWDQSAAPDLAGTPPKPWTKEIFVALRKKLEENAGSARDEALKRIEQALGRIEILDPDKTFDDKDKVPGWRKTIEAAAVKPGKYKKALAGELKALACSGRAGASAPYIVRGLVRNGRIKATGTEAPGLVEAILKPDCPVSAALTESDKAALKKQRSDAH
jgi:uncharacterized protein YjbI with pentapeptide repeats